MELIAAVSDANDAAFNAAKALQSAYDTAVNTDPMAALMLSDLVERQQQINQRLAAIYKAASV